MLSFVAKNYMTTLFLKSHFERLPKKTIIADYEQCQKFTNSSRFRLSESNGKAPKRIKPLAGY